MAYTAGSSEALHEPRQRAEYSVYLAVCQSGYPWPLNMPPEKHLEGAGLEDGPTGYFEATDEDSEALLFSFDFENDGDWDIVDQQVK